MFKDEIIERLEGIISTSFLSVAQIETVLDQIKIERGYYEDYCEGCKTSLRICEKWIELNNCDVDTQILFADAFRAACKMFGPKMLMEHVPQ